MFEQVECLKDEEAEFFLGNFLRRLFATASRQGSEIHHTAGTILGMTCLGCAFAGLLLSAQEKAPHTVLYSHSASYLHKFERN